MKIWHDADENGVWTEINAVVSYPKIITRNNNYGICSIALRDFEGGLYNTWKDRDFIPMRVTDDSENIIFRGFLISKIFHATELILVLAGIGISLEWNSFQGNYILAEGRVKQVDPDAELHVYFDENANNQYDAGEDYSWAVGEHVSGDRNRGILILDNTTETITTNAQATDETFTNLGEGDMSTVGDYTDTLTIDDGEAAKLKITADFNEKYNATLELTIDGFSIPDSNYIQKIEIEYSYGLNMVKPASVYFHYTRVRLQVKDNNDQWQIKKTVSHINPEGEMDLTYQSEYVQTPVISITGTPGQLAGHFNKTDTNYTSLKGLRFYLYGECSGGLNHSGEIKVDYVKVRIYYNTQDISPIMKHITGNNASSIICAGVNWSTTGVSSDGGGDKFFIGENTTKILTEVISAAGLGMILNSTLTKYIARKYKGVMCLDVLNAICLLEGVEWCEDYINNSIKVVAKDDFEDSGITITSSLGYDFDWEYEDKCNQIKKVEVWGNASLNVYGVAVDESVKGDQCKLVIDESINTNADAQAIAETQLALLKNKNPSIKLTLDGTQSAIQLGTTVDITLERPTVAQATYPIRMIEREKRGIGGIKTTIYAGLGETKDDEKIGKTIKNILTLARKNLSDRLISTPWSAGAIITYQDIVGFGTGVRDIIDAELVEGQSIDDAIDALISAHHDPASTDHDDRYYTETEIDAHTSNESAHHVKYTNAEARGAINNIFGADGKADKVIDMDQHRIGDLPDAEYNNDAARKLYVDTQITAAKAAIVSDAAYDPDTWDGITDIAPSKNAVRDAIVPLEAMLLYKGTWTPGSGYPADPVVGDYWICDADGVEGTIFYEYGDWIVWNGTTWDRLRGYKGDNVISVSPGDSIQAAIDEIEAVGDGVVFLEPGIHSLTATLNVDNVNVDITIRGAFDATVIDCNGNRNGLNIYNARSCMLENFKIDAADISDGLHYGVRIVEANNNKVVVRHVNVIGDGDKEGNGIRIESANVEVISCITRLLYGGIVIDSTNNCILERNICTDNNISGIYCYNSARNRIINNYCYNNDNRGIYIQGSSENLINNNYCYGNSGDGIRIYALSHRNMISENYLNGNAGYGIKFQDANPQNNKVGINYYYNNSAGDIYYTDTDIEIYDRIPFIHVRKNSSQTLTSGTTTAIQFTASDIEEEDSIGGHDPTTNNTRFTIPTGYGGLWLCEATLSFADNSVGERTILFRKNGATTGINSHISVVAQVAYHYQRLNITALIYLDEGDYVELYAYQDSGGNLNVISIATQHYTPTEVRMTRLASEII